MSAYYNEVDPQKAEWIRELIKAGVVAPGEVDGRDIKDVRPEDLREFTQCHFFAGIAVWSYSLRLAGWPDNRPCWTGSCPCPSFSCAGKGTGFDDPRHLWPVWYSLIRECLPGTVFGEQSDDAVGFGWLDLVCGDMEAEDYAIAAVVLGAHSTGAPHIRQRLYFCADSLRSTGRKFTGSVLGTEAQVSGARFADGNLADGPASGCQIVRGSDLQSDGRTGRENNKDGGWREFPSGRDGETGELRNSASKRCGEEGSSVNGPKERISGARDACEHSDAGSQGLSERISEPRIQPGAMDSQTREAIKRGGYTRGFWANCDWWYGRDGKYRPIEPGLQPLAHGATNRVLKLRGYGDAICAPLAQAFIRSYMESVEG